MDIGAQQETLGTALRDITLCLDGHYEELSVHRLHGYPWVCNFPLYFEREANGQLLLVTLRAEGILVGYFVGFVMPGLHYQTCLTLTMDVFWIKPEWRNKGAGALKLFRKVLAVAKLRGVDLAMFGEKHHVPFRAGRLFKALGFAPSETWHFKFLKGK